MGACVSGSVSVHYNQGMQGSLGVPGAVKNATIWLLFVRVAVCNVVSTIERLACPAEC